MSRVSDAERACTYENVIQNERNKGDREEDKTGREREKERDREKERKTEKRKKKTKKDDRENGFLQGLKLNDRFFLQCLQCAPISMNVYLSVVQV